MAMTLRPCLLFCLSLDVNKFVLSLSSDVHSRHVFLFACISLEDNDLLLICAGRFLIIDETYPSTFSAISYFKLEALLLGTKSCVLALLVVFYHE